MLTRQGFVSVPFLKKIGLGGTGGGGYRAYHQSLAKDSACNFVNNVKCQRLNKLRSKLQNKVRNVVCASREREQRRDKGGGIGIDGMDKKP